MGTRAEILARAVGQHDLTDVSLLIKTWQRPDCLGRLLDSIQRLELRCPIHVADDSSRPYRDQMLQRFAGLIASYDVLPAGSGLSYGRNVLLDRVGTRYFVLCDDDFVFDRRTHLGLMRDIVASTDIDLVGAYYYNRPKMTRWPLAETWRLLHPAHRHEWRKLLIWHARRIPWLRRKLPALRLEETWGYFGRLILEQDLLVLAPPEGAYRPPYIRCDFVPNFFLADIESLRTRNLRWDPALRYRGEHLDFFLAAKAAGLRVAMTRETGICHLSVDPRAYLVAPDNRADFFAKHGIRATVWQADFTPRSA